MDKLDMTIKTVVNLGYLFISVVTMVGCIPDKKIPLHKKILLIVIIALMGIAINSNLFK